MGQVLQAGVGQAPARQAALRAGLPVTTSATTINRVCGSGLKAIMLAAAEIRAGDAEVVVAGGMENMNLAPYLLPNARFGYRLGDGVVRDATIADGLWCAIEDCHMGTHAERVAAHDGVTRADQDAFALESHRRAIAAIDEGRFAAELVPVTVRDAKGRETVVAVDENPRRDTTIEALARLRPAFALPEPEPGRPAPEGVGHGRQRARDHRRRGRHGRRQRADRRGARPEAARADRRLRPGRGRAEVAVPRPDHGRPPAARADRPADRGVRPARDQRGLRRPGPGRRSRARLRLVEGQRQRRRDRPRPPDRGERGADRGDTSPRAPAARQGRYGLATLCLGGGGSVAMAFERV